MTKDVLVMISGMQHDIENEPIELITGGTYYLKNGKHYVFYEEQPDSDSPVIKNRVRFDEDHFEMVKRGGYDSSLVFDKGKKTSSVYSTPAGQVQIDVHTHDLSISENEDELLVTIRYSLDINYNFISECEVNFRLRAQ